MIHKSQWWLAAKYQTSTLNEWQQQLATISPDKLIQLLIQGANKYYKQ